MIAVGILAVAFQIASPDPLPVEPAEVVWTRSAEVVAARLVSTSLGDGQETFTVELRIKKGWHVLANVEGHDDNPERDDPPPGAATVVGVFSDLEPLDLSWTRYPECVIEKSASGEYQAYEGTSEVVVCVAYEKNRLYGGISVRIRVVATDGQRRLKPSVLTATFPKHLLEPATKAPAP